MKVTKYPANNWLNFGVRHGELYSGDVTESGRRIPHSVALPLRNYTSIAHSVRKDRFSALRNSFTARTLDYGVDVEGNAVRAQKLYSPATSTPSTIDSLRAQTRKPFVSKMGVTAGKIYYPSFGGGLLDENYELAYSIRITDHLSVVNSRSASNVVSAYCDTATILYETLTEFVVHCKSEPGASALVRVPKVSADNSASDITAIHVGAGDYEFVGHDVDGRAILIVWSDLSPTGFVGVGAGTSGVYVIRESAPGNFSFYSTSFFQGWHNGLNSTNISAHATVAAMAPHRVLDKNGAVLSFSFLTVIDSRASSNTMLQGLIGLHWRTYTVGASLVATTQPIAVPGAYTSGYLTRSTNSSGPSIAVHPMMIDGRLRAAVVLGAGKRALTHSSQEFPISILDCEVGADGALVGSPTFIELPDVDNTFSITIPDYTVGQLWQVDDTWGSSGGHHTIRCLDLIKGTVDYTSLSGTFVSAGTHNGMCLVMMYQRDGSMDKYVLQSNTRRCSVSVEFDAAQYALGDTATITVTSEFPIEATLELEGCSTSSGDDVVNLVVVDKVTLNVTITASPSARVTAIGVLE